MQSQPGYYSSAQHAVLRFYVKDSSLTNICHYYYIQTASVSSKNMTNNKIFVHILLVFFTVHSRSLKQITKYISQQQNQIQKPHRIGEQDANRNIFMAYRTDLYMKYSLTTALVCVGEQQLCLLVYFSTKCSYQLYKAQTM